MSDKAKRLIKLTEIAIEKNDLELTEKLIKATLVEYIKDIRIAIMPISETEVPFVIATLENHSRVLREMFPDACQAADDLLKIPVVAIARPEDGGTENDR